MRVRPILCVLVLPVMLLCDGCGRHETAWDRPGIHPVGALFGPSMDSGNVASELARARDSLADMDQRSSGRSSASARTGAPGGAQDAMAARMKGRFDVWSAARISEPVFPGRQHQSTADPVEVVAADSPAAPPAPAPQAEADPVPLSSVERLNLRIKVAILESRLGESSGTQADALRSKIEDARLLLGRADDNRSVKVSPVIVPPPSMETVVPPVQTGADGLVDLVGTSPPATEGITLGPASGRMHIGTRSKANPHTSWSHPESDTGGVRSAATRTINRVIDGMRRAPSVSRLPVVRSATD